VLAAVEQGAPQAICIAAVSQSSQVNARFYCRRLRALFPDVQLLVYSPDIHGKRLKEADARLREAGANGVVGSVREATRAFLAPQSVEPPPSSSTLTRAEVCMKAG
jgi:hypothetical protein